VPSTEALIEATIGLRQQRMSLVSSTAFLMRPSA
jgi:hypothetical protein